MKFAVRTKPDNGIVTMEGPIVEELETDSWEIFDNKDDYKERLNQLTGS